MNTSDYHVHSYNSVTSYNHVHCLSGVTGNRVPTGGSHIHFYDGVTTFENGHVHYYSGATGPEILYQEEGTPIVIMGVRHLIYCTPITIEVIQVIRNRQDYLTRPIYSPRYCRGLPYY